MVVVKNIGYLFLRTCCTRSKRPVRMDFLGSWLPRGQFARLPGQVQMDFPVSREATDVQTQQPKIQVSVPAALDHLDLAEIDPTWGSVTIACSELRILHCNITNVYSNFELIIPISGSWQLTSQPDRFLVQKKFAQIQGYDIVTGSMLGPRMVLPCNMILLRQELHPASLNVWLWCPRWLLKTVLLSDTETFLNLKEDRRMGRMLGCVRSGWPRHNDEW